MARMTKTSICWSLQAVIPTGCGVRESDGIDIMRPDRILYDSILYLRHFLMVWFEWSDWSHGTEETSNNVRKQITLYTICNRFLSTHIFNFPRKFRIQHLTIACFRSLFPFGARSSPTLGFSEIDRGFRMKSILGVNCLNFCEHQTKIWHLRWP
jgi:hypothetical protein